MRAHDSSVTGVARLLELDVAGRGRIVALGLDESRLQVDDVVAQLVVFGLDGFVVLVQQVVVPYLLFELFDVPFFALPEGPLYSQMLVSWILVFVIFGFVLGFTIFTSLWAGKQQLHE